MPRPASSDPSDGPELAPAVLRALAARHEPDGFLPFDRFEEVSLYGEGVGYYRRAGTPFGPEGDFYTAPRVHPLFARTLALRLADVRFSALPSGPCELVDLGAGDGSLLAGIVRALAERGRAGGTGAVIVDRSPARRAAAVETVRTAAQPAGVEVRGAASLAELGPVSGVVVANELLDAQPVRRFRWDGSAWQELGFRLDGGRLVPAASTVRGPVPAPPLPALAADRAGTVLEVSASAQGIVREVADHLVRGWFVAIDFGDDEPNLLAGHPSGTVAAVRRHRALDDVARAPGRSDLSAFVNFSRVRHAAGAAGLVELAYRSQAEALGAWGFEAELAQALARVRSAEEQVRLRLAAKNLLFGFGTFRALELAPRASGGALAGLSGVGRAASR